MIRAAIVGVSGYGRWHLLMAMEQALVGRVQLVGATIINPEEEAVICARMRRQGIRVFGRFDDMIHDLRGRIDLVLVPTAIQWHTRMTVAALGAGAHVLVEKPAAATLQEIDEMIAARERAGRIVAVGFQDLYVPSAHEIKGRVLAGEIGPLRRICVRGQWPRPHSYYLRNAWAGRLRAEGGWVLDSPVSNAYAHFLMLALFWAGAAPMTAAEVVAVEAELYRVHAIESFDTVCFRANTDAGVEIVFHGSHAGRKDCPPEIRLQGERGRIVWRYENDYVVLPKAGAPQRHPVPNQLDTRLTVLEAVVGRLQGGSRFIVEPELTRAHTRLMNALHEFFPIDDVDPAQIVETGRGEEKYRRIRGLDGAIHAASVQGTLFSETGAPWARRGERRELAGYQRFQGCLSEGVAGGPRE